MTITRTDVRTVDDLEQSALRSYSYGLTRFAGFAYTVAKAAVAKGTPVQLKLRSVAEMIGQVLANQRALEDARMPDTSMGDDLDRLCEIHDVEKSPGAGASGEVIVTTSGSVTYPAESELVSSGKRYRVISTTTVGNGGRVAVVGKDIGRSTNLKAGTKLTWISPPGGSAVDCVVAPEGISNGQDADTEATRRKRLRKVIAGRPGAGNWAQKREWAEKASASVQDAYVYPAVHGPGTEHVAIVVEGTADNLYGRAASDALLAIVRPAVLAQQPKPFDLIITTVSHTAAALAVKVSLPAELWLDATPWPSSLAAVGVTVSTVITLSTITVNATTAPAVGKRIAIWDSSSFSFQRAVVASFSGTSGNYTLNLDRPLPNVATGGYVCPDSARLDDYARVLCEQIATLSPGQRTFNTGRSVRHPPISPERPSQISTIQLARLQAAFSEMVSATWVGINGVAPTGPIAPGAATGLNQLPNIFRVSQIGFYA